MKIAGWRKRKSEVMAKEFWETGNVFLVFVLLRFNPFIIAPLVTKAE